MTRERAVIAVVVKPGSKAPGFSVADGAVVVRVREPARDNKANEAVRLALAHRLRVAPSSVTLVRGGASRHKRFAIDGLDVPAARRRLSDTADDT